MLLVTPSFFSSGSLNSSSDCRGRERERSGRKREKGERGGKREKKIRCLQLTSNVRTINMF